MKKILIGNKYLGYQPIDQDICSCSIYCPTSISPKDITDWVENAGHGDIFELAYERGHLMCVEK